MAVLLAFLGWLLGAMATIVIAIWVEYLRSPSLRLSFEAPSLTLNARGPINTRFRIVRIKVFNEPLPDWANHWLVRLPAQQCRAEVAFLRQDATASSIRR